MIFFFKPCFPARDNPGSIIWLTTTATGSQNHGIPLHGTLYDSQRIFSKPRSINLGDYSSTTIKAEDYLGDYTSIVPVVDNPSFIIWLPTTATSPPQYSGNFLH
jgi:hypothetical protein